MELWIRSQSKISLNKVNGVYYGAEGEFWAIYEKGETFNYLGLYTTKERCLEILDEIQKLLYCGFVTVNTNTNIKDLEKTIKQKGSILHFPKEPLVEYHSVSTVVYEMPEK